MARRKRASMREGPLADLFRATVDPDDPPEAPMRPDRAPEEETSVMRGEQRQPPAPQREEPEPEPRPYDAQPDPQEEDVRAHRADEPSTRGRHRRPRSACPGSSTTTSPTSTARRTAATSRATAATRPSPASRARTRP